MLSLLTLVKLVNEHFVHISWAAGTCRIYVGRNHFSPAMNNDYSMVNWPYKPRVLLRLDFAPNLQFRVNLQKLEFITNIESK